MPSALQLALGDAPALRGHIFGLTASVAADTEHDLTFAAGVAASDATAPVLMPLTSALTKRFDDTWVAGTTNGGMMSGQTLPASGTVHVHLMQRSDTGAVDIIGVPNGVTLVLPSPYDRSRRIMSFRTNSSNNIVNFKQVGDMFYLGEQTVDADAYSLTTADAEYLIPLTVPNGIKVYAKVSIYCYKAAATPEFIISSPEVAHQAPGASYPWTIYSTFAGASESYAGDILTDTSGRIRISSSQSSSGCYITTISWTDTREKDA